jgi:hypothetical protein
MATGFISFLQNNPDILLNPKRSISISVGTTMSINIIGTGQAFIIASSNTGDDSVKALRLTLKA